MSSDNGAKLAYLMTKLNERGTANFAAIIRELDEAGAEGWELVSVIHQPGGLDLATGHALQGVNRYFLKRPRPNLIDAN